MGGSQNTRLTDAIGKSQIRAMTDAVPISIVFEKAGGKRALAQRLGLDVSSPYSWRRVPDRHVAAVAQMTGIPAAQLRPDLAAAFVKPRRTRATAPSAA